ncbi:MAG: LysR family transcriptional regulator [Myxococcales bacterium]|nr:LysR family transcriptional regulator [Myxococcales bacterium]MCB9651563.1 LysR family transcriptional regulator [Deltaproteobacteria bacterium]
MIPHPFTLRQLQYVVAVADALNFRRAAEQCHVSQPSLSAQLAQLEDAIGVQLFERDRRGVLLTSAGAELVARARRLLLEADDLVSAARRVGDPLKGSLRLGIIPTISPYLLPAVSPAVRAAFPELRPLWVEDKTEALMESLARGALDGALVALEAPLGDVEYEEVAVDPFVLAAPPGHPLVKKASRIAHAELAGQHILLLDDGHCFREQALSFCSTARAHELAFRATSLSTLAQMVAGGAGVTLLPKLAVATEAHRAGLKVRAFAAPAPHRTLALVWRRRAPIAEALRALAKVIRGAYPKS